MALVAITATRSCKCGNSNYKHSGYPTKKGKELWCASYEGTHMDNKNISSDKNQTKESIQKNKRAERELERITGEPFVEKVMEILDGQRKKRQKGCGKYTQEYVAEKAGISISTYRGYVKGRSHCIDLITAKGIADLLGCQLSKVIEKAEHGRPD